MQIDVLSQNTLKLTLSRVDMFDLDIKYESLSGKNPDTKRLLSHVLRTVKLDKSAGVDFSGERLFVEAFPRPDGGCMLYISCLLEEREREREKEETGGRGRRLSLSTSPSGITNATHTSSGAGTGTTKKTPPEEPRKTGRSQLLFRFDSIRELDGACKSLSWQQEHGRLDVRSTLYSNGSEYRLLVCGDDKKLINAALAEYGEPLSTEHHLAFTAEHYNLLVNDNAIEKMSAVL